MNSDCSCVNLFFFSLSYFLFSFSSFLLPLGFMKKFLHHIDFNIVSELVKEDKIFSLSLTIDPITFCVISFKKIIEYATSTSMIPLSMKAIFKEPEPIFKITMTLLNGSNYFVWAKSVSLSLWRRKTWLYKWKSSKAWGIRCFIQWLGDLEPWWAGY